MIAVAAAAAEFICHEKYYKQSTKYKAQKQKSTNRTRESAVRGTTSILAPEIIGKLINY